MPDISRKASPRTITTRLPPATHDRLLRMSKEANENVAEIVRQLLARALDDQPAEHLVTSLMTLNSRLTAIAGQLATLAPMLSALHTRLMRVEQLACLIDANATHRREIDHRIGWKQWSQIQSDLMEVQEAVFATFETCMAARGKTRAQSLSFYDRLRTSSKESFDTFRTTVLARCAEMEATAPSLLHPAPISEEEQQALEALRTSPVVADIDGELAADEAEPDDDQHELFDENADDEAGGPTAASAARSEPAAAQRTPCGEGAAS